jgi:hypothetical protein
VEFTRIVDKRVGEGTTKVDSEMINGKMALLCMYLHVSITERRECLSQVKVFRSLGVQQQDLLDGERW